MVPDLHHPPPDRDAMPVTTLGERIEDLRLERDMGVNDLARAAGLRSGYVSLVERDSYRHTSVYVVRKIAAALGVTIDALMEGVEDPPPRAAPGRRSPRAVSREARAAAPTRG